jgi:hypothetical protein
MLGIAGNLSWLKRGRHDFALPIMICSCAFCVKLKVCDTNLMEGGMLILC